MACAGRAAAVVMLQAAVFYPTLNPTPSWAR